MSSLQDSLASAIRAPENRPRSAHTLPEVVNVSLLEDGSVEVTPLDLTTVGVRLKEPNILFLELRRKIRELTGDSSWTVRYAAKVEAPLLPFLHSSKGLKILIDPMSPYRSPIDALSKVGVLILVLLPSHVYYFKPKNEVLRDHSSSKG